MGNKEKKASLINAAGKKWVLLCLAVIPFLLLIFPVIIFKNRPLVIFPAPEVQNHILATTDRYMDGKSVIDKFSYDEKVINLRYTLKEGAPFPQVFFILTIGTPEKPLNLSHYDTVTVRIREATNKRILLYIKTFMPGISRPEYDKTPTFRHNQYNLQLHPGRHLYTIKLKKFITSLWWFDMMKINKSQVPEESFSNTISFDMVFSQEGSDFVLNKPEHIVIEKIAFRSSLSIIDYILLWCAGFYGSGWLIFSGISLLKKRGTRLPQRKPLVVLSYREKELLRIREFIEANYFQEKISTHMVYKALGIPPSRIFKLVKEEYHLTFKQLINRMRIEEAKRILKETDLRIIDIALSLGFNNVTYFNNLFKELEGITPSDYRKHEIRLKE